MGLLPGGERAYVDPAKIAGYLLSPHHRVGRHKARIFASVLGLTDADAPFLTAALQAAAAGEDATNEGADVFGARYVIEFRLVHQTRTAKVRSAWIIRHGEDFPRFVTALISKQD